MDLNQLFQKAKYLKTALPTTHLLELQIWHNSLCEEVTPSWANSTLFLQICYPFIKHSSWINTEEFRYLINFQLKIFENDLHIRWPDNFIQKIEKKIKELMIFEKDSHRPPYNLELSSDFCFYLITELIYKDPVTDLPTGFEETLSLINFDNPQNRISAPFDRQWKEALQFINTRKETTEELKLFSDLILSTSLPINLTDDLPKIILIFMEINSKNPIKKSKLKKSYEQKKLTLSFDKLYDALETQGYLISQNQSKEDSFFIFTEKALNTCSRLATNPELNTFEEIWQLATPPKAWIKALLKKQTTEKLLNLFNSNTQSPHALELIEEILNRENIDQIVQREAFVRLLQKFKTTSTLKTKVLALNLLFRLNLPSKIKSAIIELAKKEKSQTINDQILQLMTNNQNLLKGINFDHQFHELSRVLK